ncbi:MAG: GtrA family protein [Coriobacteriia bacterium]|nr:GtrA family protein [Coriobacteriia bacterium]
MSDLRQSVSNVYDVHGEKFRYLVVGVMNTLVNYAMFALAIRFLSEPLEAAAGVDHKTAAIILQWATWIVAVVWSTTTMKYLVFRSKGHFGHEVFRAYFIYLPAQGLSSLILWSGMHFLGLSALVAQLAAIVVTTVISYLGHKYFTFKKPSGQAEPPVSE